MTEPRFKVGELVQVDAASGMDTADAFKDASLRNNVLGIYEVAEVLPKDYGEPQYRLRRGDGSPDQVARRASFFQLSACRSRGPRGASSAEVMPWTGGSSQPSRSSGC